MWSCRTGSRMQQLALVNLRVLQMSTSTKPGATPVSGRKTLQKLFDKGLKQRKATLGAAYVEANLAAADDFTRPFQEAMTGWCWGFGWGDTVIDAKTRSLMNLAMLGALGKWHEWETHCRGALTNGVTPDEIRATVHVVAIYCGVPQGVECFRSARKVLQAEGKPLPTGFKPATESPIELSDMFEEGLRQRKAQLLGAVVVPNLDGADNLTRPFQEAMTAWVWGFGWGDTTIDAKTRSMMVLALLGAQKNWNSWENYCKGALARGVTPEQIRAIVHVIGIYCGVPQALDCFRTARKVLEAQGKMPKSA